MEIHNKINLICKKLVEMEIEELEKEIKFKKERLKLLKEIHKLDIKLKKEIELDDTK